MSNNLLEVSGLCKTYEIGENRVEVLTGITLALEAATTTALVGASGAGKSTLLHLLGALDRPTSGTVHFLGDDIFQKNDRELASFRNRSIGFVFQFHHLLPEFTALENVCIPAFIGGTPKKEAEARAKVLLELLNLSDRLSHKPSALSGGEQQRVAVARSLINNPRIVMADEPSGNLDSAAAKELHELFFKLREQIGQTFIIVTHNQELAAMADRTITMKDGKIE